MLIGTCHCKATGWALDGDPGTITVCNCTLCRRWGALWAYDWENERIRLAGESAVYTRADRTDPHLEFRFCPTCACVLAWRERQPAADGRRRMAVNVRLAPPEAVADLKIDYFDGLDTFEDLPVDDRCVRHFWFRVDDPQADRTGPADAPDGP